MFNIEDTIGFSLHHASYAFKTAMKSVFRNNGYEITPEEFITLFLISDEGVDQSDLILKSLKEKTNITRLLNRMLNRGWVIRKPHPQNARQQRLILTKKGIILKNTLLPLIQKMVIRSIDNIADADIEITIRTLNSIIKNIAI
ncbi:MAG: MarR family transcriptional regulator [Kangiellaceae bacterium]|nr:MarR family transcriptional regulator [Kangiellaceae bacterium]